MYILPDAELPRATQTSALSSAGVLRLFNRVGETVNKMTFKMDESDQVGDPSPEWPGIDILYLYLFVCWVVHPFFSVFLVMDETDQLGAVLQSASSFGPSFLSTFVLQFPVFSCVAIIPIAMLCLIFSLSFKMHESGQVIDSLLSFSFIVLFVSHVSSFLLCYFHFLYFFFSRMWSSVLLCFFLLFFSFIWFCFSHPICHLFGFPEIILCFFI